MTSEVERVLQGLECCLCFQLLVEPKLLSCTHSFCEKCLQLLHNSQGKGTELSCPLCRQITPISNKDVSSLKTNVPLKSMVGEVKTGRKLCTVCDPEAKSPALHYCPECDEYMCDGCLKGHGGFKKTASHVVVSIEDIKSGKVKVKQMCHEHEGEERLWVCTTCKVSICFRCRMLYHNGSDHVVEDIKDFKKNMKDETESLKKRGIEKMTRIMSYTNIVQEQTAKVETIIAEREADINKAFDETLLQLNAKKNALLDQCKGRKRKLTDELCNQGKNWEELITSLSSACELVGNGVKTLLEGDALEVHRNLCRELKNMLDRDDPDESKSEKIKRQVEGITFTPCRLDDEHNLGMLNIKDWDLEKVAKFPVSDMAHDGMTSTKDGKMLVWSRNDGRIEEFTVSGSQKRGLKDVGVVGVSVLSDGRYVVCHDNGKFSLYSSQWNKLDTKEFEVKISGKCKLIDVDKYNNIYVVFHNTTTIRVFTPEGGAPIMKIPCHGYKPLAVCTMNHSNLLVVSYESTVQVIDQHGGVKHHVRKKGYSCSYGAPPAVLHDDSILIAWKTGCERVRIELYTNQLKYVRLVETVYIDDEEEEDDIYYSHFSDAGALGEFSTGEIALCLCRRMFVFRKC